MRTLTAADGTAVYFKAIVFNLLVQLFGSIVLTIVTTAATVGENAYMTLNFVLMALIQAVFFLAVYSSVRKKKLALAYPVRPVKWFIALSAFLSSVVCILCFALPAQWFYLLLEKAGYSFSDPVSFETPVNLALGILVTVILAPLCEELVFRGALLGGLVKKYGVAASVLISGAAFALMHMNPEQTVYQFFLGCVCAWFAICSGSVLPSMLLHSGNNLVAVLLEFIPSAGEESAALGAADVLTTVLLFVAGAAVVYFLGRLMLKNRSGAGKGLIFDFRVHRAVKPDMTVNRDNVTLCPDNDSSGNDASCAKDGNNATPSDKDGFSLADASKQAVSGGFSADSSTESGLDSGGPACETSTDKKKRRENVYTGKFLLEGRLDENDVREGRRRNALLGKKTHVILLCLGLGVCVFMWLFVFAANLSGLM